MLPGTVVLIWRYDLNLVDDEEIPELERLRVSSEIKRWLQSAPVFVQKSENGPRGIKGLLWTLLDRN